jgi:hypothetical protein
MFGFSGPAPAVRKNLKKDVFFIFTKKSFEVRNEM